MSAYLRFNGEFCKKWVQDGGEHKEAMAAAGKRWAELTDEDKTPYQDAAAAAKELHEKQLGELKKQGYYHLPDGSKSTDPQNAHLSQPDRTGTHPPPKRPPSAWLYFNTDTVKELVESGVARTDAFRQAGARWASMSAEEKRPYEDKAGAAKAVAEKQTAELKKKGYYTLEDGSKSTDPQNAHLLKIKKKRSKKVQGATEDEEENELDV